MKISKRTIEILKNFSSINNSIFFDEPGVIKTTSIAGNITGIADIDEQDIPDFGIYNLSEFLGMINLFDVDETDFMFEKKYVLVKCGRRRFRYVYTDIDLLPTFGMIRPSDKYKAFNKFDCNFNLSESDIAAIRKASSVMRMTHLDIKAKNSIGHVEIRDEDNGFSNTFSTDITTEGDCDLSLKVENLTLVNGNYKVDVFGKKLIKFTRECGQLMYFISPKS